MCGPDRADPGTQKWHLAMTKPSNDMLRLGVNIDHVATLRNARGGTNPDPVAAAMLVAEAGGHGITAHLREDRRHIRDEDIERIKNVCDLPLNFEMANTEEMVEIACRILPNACCLVPERRAERTTEHGLDVAGNIQNIQKTAKKLRDKGIRISLFVDPIPEQIEAAAQAGADIVELHTGTYCELTGKEQQAELNKLKSAAKLSAELGLEPHAGHGLDTKTVGAVAAIREVVELNIGHSIIADSVFKGFVQSVRDMRSAMDHARASQEKS